jgi:hypothetical protein
LQAVIRARAARAGRKKCFIKLKRGDRELAITNAARING